MSDERLREAERRWKESGSVEDEARYLLERVRVGELSRELLRLAGHSGHDASRLAMELGGAPPADMGLREFRDWCLALRGCGKLACVLVAAVMAEKSSTALANTRLGNADFFPDAMMIIRNWLACPCAEHSLHAHDAWRHLPDWHAVRSHFEIGPSEHVMLWHALSIYYSVKATGTAPHARTPSGRAEDYLATKASRLAAEASCYTVRALGTPILTPALKEVAHWALLPVSRPTKLG